MSVDTQCCLDQIKHVVWFAELSCHCCNRPLSFCCCPLDSTLPFLLTMTNNRPLLDNLSKAGWWLQPSSYFHVCPKQTTVRRLSNVCSDFLEVFEQRAEAVFFHYDQTSHCKSMYSSIHNLRYCPWYFAKKKKKLTSKRPLLNPVLKCILSDAIAVVDSWSHRHLMHLSLRSDFLLYIQINMYVLLQAIDRRSRNASGYIYILDIFTPELVIRSPETDVTTRSEHGQWSNTTLPDIEIRSFFQPEIT